MGFIEVAGYTSVAIYLSFFFSFLGKLSEKNMNVIWVIFDIFIASITTLMAFMFSLAIKSIKSQILQFN